MNCLLSTNECSFWMTEISPFSKWKLEKQCYLCFFRRILRLDRMLIDEEQHPGGNLLFLVLCSYIWRLQVFLWICFGSCGR